MKLSCGCELGWVCRMCCGRSYCEDPVDHAQAGWWYLGRQARCTYFESWFQGPMREWTRPRAAARMAWLRWHEKRCQDRRNAYDNEELREELFRIRAQFQAMKV